MNNATNLRLSRHVNLGGAVMMGLGSIVGTGVFVSLGLGSGLAGPAMILSLALAGVLAVCNGLSSAQLAAAHPVSGGTYEYGYQYLNPWFGFSAGWLFVCAKSASAATAAIGFGGYFIHLLSIESVEPWQLGLVVTLIVCLVCLMGIRRSSLTNTIIVSVTLISLGAFVLFLLRDVKGNNFKPFFMGSDFKVKNFLEATALMFVAYTGYGRIATLGEEMENPKRNIPMAIGITLVVSFVLYMAVATVAIGTVGAGSYYELTIGGVAPLEQIALLARRPLLSVLLGIGAVTAMFGVLLNLVLGVSRVIFAMGRKQDLPKTLAKISPTTKAPYISIMATVGVIFLLTLMKDVKATWSFSAFTVLCYYAITNASALKLPRHKQLYPRFFSWVGLLGCLSLGAFVDLWTHLLGGALLAMGFVWRYFFKNRICGDQDDERLTGQ